MTRLPPLPPEAIENALGASAGTLRSSYGSEVYGGWLEVVEARLHCPEVGRIALEWRNFARATIPPPYRNTAFLVTSLEAGALRVFCDHVGDAINDGMRPEAAAALFDGLDHELTPDEIETVTYVRSFIRGRISDALFSALLERLGPSVTVAFNYLIGMTLNGILCQLAVGLEQPTVDQARARLTAVTAAFRAGEDLSQWLATSPAEYTGAG